MHNQQNLLEETQSEDMKTLGVESQPTPNSKVISFKRIMTSKKSQQ